MAHGKPFAANALMPEATVEATLDFARQFARRKTEREMNLNRLRVMALDLSEPLRNVARDPNLHCVAVLGVRVANEVDATRLFVWEHVGVLFPWQERPHSRAGANAQFTFDKIDCQNDNQ